MSETDRAMRIDLGPVAAAVGRALHGEVSPERIDTVLQDLMDTEFGDVRVTTFVPIFLQRWACDRLRGERHIPH